MLTRLAAVGTEGLISSGAEQHGSSVVGESGSSLSHCDGFFWLDLGE
jgi:hypothetical protein